MLLKQKPILLSDRLPDIARRYGWVCLSQSKPGGDLDQPVAPVKVLGA